MFDVAYDSHIAERFKYLKINSLQIIYISTVHHLRKNQ